MPIEAEHTGKEGGEGRLRREGGGGGEKKGGAGGGEGWVRLMAFPQRLDD